MFFCQGLSLTLKNGNQIITDFNMVLNNGDKLALMGEEGSGKSTLLKFLYDSRLIDSYCFYKGSTNLEKSSIAYLPQTIENHWLNFSAIEFLAHETIDSDFDYETYNHLFDIEQWFDYLLLDKTLLDETRKISTLSGGEKIKLQLVKILRKHPKLILLDEPTNDLDISTLEVFEQLMNRIETPIIFISHDETLLTNVATQILHLEQIKHQKLAKSHYEKMGYQTYVEYRQRQIEQHNRKAYRTKKEQEKRRQILMHQHLLVENDLDRASGQSPAEGRILAKKMKNIKSQEKRLSEMEVVDYYKQEEQMSLFFDDQVSLPKGKVILDLHLDELRVGHRRLAGQIDIKIVGPEHVFIIGPNGSGKTTLIRHILAGLEKTKNIRIGYMPQNYEEGFDITISPVAYLQSKLGYDTKMKSQIMTFLAVLNFIEEEMNSPIHTLSGGLKAKLYLLEMVMNKYDVLLLDEPTRNLSPLSSPTVIDMLNKFKGALIVVTHSRMLLSAVSSTTYLLSEGSFIINHTN